MVEDRDDARVAVYSSEIEKEDVHHFVHRYLVSDILNESDEKVGEDTDSIHVPEAVHCGELENAKFGEPERRK